MTHTLRARIILPLTAAVLALGIGSAPTQALAKTQQAPQGDKGVHYTPEAFRKLATKPQFVLVDLRNPNDVTAFASKPDFDKAVADAEASLAAGIGVASAGQWLDIYSDDEFRGDSRRIESAWSINDLHGVFRCYWWGCVGDWNDVISSVWVNGSATLYTEPGGGGGWFWIGGYGGVNMSTYGLDNVISSLDVWW